MHRLLEILGRGLNIDPLELVLDWFDAADNHSHQEDSLAQIIEFIRESRTDKAYSELDLYLHTNPTSDKAHLAAAAICLNNRQVTKAADHLELACKTKVNNTIILFLRGYCQELLGKNGEAIKFYQDCLKFKSYLQLPRYRLAAIYFKNGQLDKTINEYELLAKDFPDELAIFLTLGSLYLVCQNYEKAEKAFNNAILMTPDTLDENDGKCNKLIANGKYYQALEMLELDISNQGETAPLIAKRAEILAMMGSFEESLQEYQRVVRTCPDFLEANIKLGSLCIKLNEREQAARYFLRAIEINDKIVDSYLGVARVLKQQNKISKAVTALSLAAAIQPNSSILLLETSRLMYSFENDSRDEDPELMPAEQIIDLHKEQMISDPQNTDNAFRLAMILMAVNKFGQSCTILRDILKINPFHWRAANLLAICYFELGQQQQTAIDFLPVPALADARILKIYYKTAILYCDKIKFASSLMNFTKHSEDNYAGFKNAESVSVILQDIGVLQRDEIMWDNINDSAKKAMAKHA